MNIRTDDGNLTTGVKLILIAGITLVLMIPSTMIRILITEREQRQKETIQEVNSKWANAQILCGPILTIPFSKQIMEDKKVVVVTDYAHFAPTALKINGKIDPKTKNRGIYKVLNYTSLLHFEGEFEQPDFSTWGIQDKDIHWKEAYLSIGLSDLRGINKEISVQWDGNEYATQSSSKLSEILTSGINTKIPVSAIASKRKFSFTIDLNGSEYLKFIPLGKQTTVTLQSGYTNPSFQGSFLPPDPVITENGFTANWKILELNLNYPEKWLNNEYKFKLKPPYSYELQADPNDLSFGVSLIQPVNNYQMSERSVKYSILFLALTFLIVFFAEMILKKRIHAMQYILIGFALCIFYSLLMALSEYMKFQLAYLIASVVIISMIGAFVKSLFHSGRMAFIMISILIVLYSFLFVLLILEDYSMLFGNIGLVVILGIVMIISRKIEWNETKTIVKGE